MTTSIIMLVLLTGPYVVVCLVSPAGRRLDARTAAAVGLALLFTFTGMGHFIETESMVQMLPAWVPERTLLVYLSGVLEFVVAAGFLVRRTRRMTGWVAAILLVLFLPLNVYAAIHHVPMGGHEWGPVYLLIRVPLQMIILLWVYWFTIRMNQVFSP